MLDAKPILDRWLTEDDYLALGTATASAYKACDDLFRSNLVLANFVTGMQSRSYLVNPFVENGLATIANDREGFFYEFRPNVAKNWWHLRLHKGQVTITAHFLGRKNDRAKARSANCRALLASRNLDLFKNEKIELTDESAHIYCHLLHGGLIRPDAICLAIPAPDQTVVSHSMPLPNPEPNLTSAEQIREEMTFKLLRLEVEENGSTKAS